MLRSSIAGALALALIPSAGPAEARKPATARFECLGLSCRVVRQPQAPDRAPDARPRARCGRPQCSARVQRSSIAGWRHAGRPAQPGFDVIVVWRDHVGKIVSDHPDARGRWLIVTGDGFGEVQTCWRSLAGAIAFRTLDPDQ